MAFLDTLAYGVGQTARVGWFLGQYRSARQLAPRLEVDEDLPPSAFPTGRELWAEFRGLFRRDLANIRRGVYPQPFDLFASPAERVRDSLRFFADLPAVHLRRRGAVHREATLEPLTASYPNYYVRNFHYQSDGYLSARSAALYDTQVETLFMGAADAMRRQVLVPLRAALGDGAGRRLVDLACGTGRFTRFAADAMPALDIVGVDLSRPYLTRAGALLCGYPRVRWVEANGEALPLETASVDAVSTIFLYHELPLPAQRRIAGEIARVLKPGGVLVLLDSLQHGDRPSHDALIERFPKAFHEPFYRDYAQLDLGRLFDEAGLTLRDSSLEFMAKRLTLVRR